MNFYVFQQDYDDPEAHLLDIFVGPEPPKIDGGAQLKEFKNNHELYKFLATAKADQIYTFRHPLCPEDLIDELNHWLELHLSFHAINQSEGVCDGGS